MCSYISAIANIACFASRSCNASAKPYASAARASQCSRSLKSAVVMNSFPQSRGLSLIIASERNYDRTSDYHRGRAVTLVARIHRAKIPLRNSLRCPSGGTTMAIVLSVAGMVLAFVGSGLAALAVIVSEQTATALASTRWDFNEALRRAILQQSRAAAIGLGLVAVGTL